VGEGFTREEYDRLKAAYEAAGYTVVSKYRRGLKSIRLGDVVLSDAPHGPREQSRGEESTCSDTQSQIS
jgi:hypothetical protein